MSAKTFEYERFETYRQPAAPVKSLIFHCLSKSHKQATNDEAIGLELRMATQSHDSRIRRLSAARRLTQAMRVEVVQW